MACPTFHDLVFISSSNASRRWKETSVDSTHSQDRGRLHHALGVRRVDASALHLTVRPLRAGSFPLAVTANATSNHPGIVVTVVGRP